MTLRFKVLEGTHYENNPNFSGDNPHSPDRFIRFEKGSVVETDRELDKVWVNKFERIQEPLPQKVSEERKREVDQMVEDGFWPEEDRSLWEQMPPAQYERIKDHFIQQKAPSRTFQKAPDGPLAESKPSESKQEPKVVEPSQEAAPSLGEDVTDKYAKAKDTGLRVFRNPAGKYQVTTTADQSRPLNPQVLNQSQVNGFIDSYLKEK